MICQNRLSGQKCLLVKNYDVICQYEPKFKEQFRQIVRSSRYPVILTGSDIYDIRNERNFDIFHF